jgi:flagellin-like protein
MMLRIKRNDAVSPVIAVILMVAITVVLAGVLYVWVTSLSDTKDTEVKAYQLIVKDASFDKDFKGEAFAAGDQIIQVTHNGGDPIDWNGHEVLLENSNTSERIAIVPDTIAGAAYDIDTNSKSEVGQFIIFKTVADGDFQSGDWVKIIVISGKDIRYKSPGYVVIN